MLLNTQRQVYIRHDDSLNAIRYCHAELRKILISCNFQFLEIAGPKPTEAIGIASESQPNHKAQGGQQQLRNIASELQPECNLDNALTEDLPKK